MKIFELHRAQTVGLARKDVFSFFENPENLAKITPTDLGFKILTPSPIVMREGALIDYVVHVAGLPIRWTSVISEYDPPNHFVDIQLKGPYSYWHHTHRFSDCPEGTRIEDHVRYALPFGPIGALIEKAFVRSQLNTIFNYRQRAIDDFVKGRSR